MNSHIENTLISYAELLKEKDARIREKEETIAFLKELEKDNRTQKKRLLWFIGTFVTFIVALLIVDVMNGHFGYFRY